MRKMNTVSLSSGALAIAALISTNAHAASASLQRLTDLLAAQQGTAAWAEAVTLRPAMESDPAFDYLYGTAAFASGHYHEAVFALERVLVVQPGNVQARYTLAKTFQAMGDRENALEQFEAVRQSNPPPDILRDTEQQIGRTVSNQKGSFNGYVETTVGHDNNINSATSSNTITPPSGLQIDIDPAARKMSDMYGTVQAGLDYFHPLSTNNILEVKGRYAERDNFSSDRYDSTLYRGSIGLRHQAGADLYRVTFTTHDYRLSDSDYQRLFGVNGDWVHPLSANTALLANVYVNGLRYADAPQRDINQYIGNVGLQITDVLLTHTVGMMLGTEDALRDTDGDFNSRDFTTLYYDVRYAVAPEHQLFARASAQESKFNGEDPVFLEHRDDILKQLTVGHSWQLNRHWRWKSELGYSNNKGDVNFYSFERTYVQTGIRYSF